MKTLISNLKGNLYLNVSIGLSSIFGLYWYRNRDTNDMEFFSLKEENSSNPHKIEESTWRPMFNSYIPSFFMLGHTETSEQQPFAEFRELASQLTEWCGNRLSYFTKQRPQALLQHLTWLSEHEDYLSLVRDFEKLNILINSMCGLVLSSSTELEDLESQMLAARFLANLSQFADSLSVFHSSAIENVIENWSQSESIHLQLCAYKIELNIQSTQSNTLTRLVFRDAVYPLAGFDTDDLLKTNDDNEDEGIDIVFVNGMRGSVFHTWRQFDGPGYSEEEPKTKCWPKDWLAKDLPRARIYGLNVKLLPFMNDQYKHSIYDKRPLKLRAEILREQLIDAGLGKRPIVWIGHSAGGIFIKHILHSSAPPLEQTDDERLVSASERAIPAELRHTDLLDRTVGALFISTPHRGSQSLDFLYYFPMKYTLTQESKELARDDEILIELHEWFMKESKQRGIHTLNMMETLQTNISSFWSVLIVPGDERDTDFDETVHVPANHIEVSKPKDCTDCIYTTTLRFIRSCRSSEK